MTTLRRQCWRFVHRSAAAAMVGMAMAASVATSLEAQQGALDSRAPAPRFADPDRAQLLTGAFPEIDQRLRAFATQANVPGIAYGVVIDGRLVHVGVAGHREVASRSLVDTSTVFRIASMSKSFAALAILQLRDADLVSLDAPAERYVPELARLRYATSDAPRITLRDLLSHSAGFPEDNPWGDQQLARTEAELTALLERGIPFSTSPATGYEYSNFGYAILGRVVANVSRMPYAQYLRERVLLPLGMTSTTLEAQDVPPARLAHGYRRQDGTWLEEAQLPDGSFGPMGGMLTSVADLSKWVGFMLDAWPARDDAETGPVKRSSVREMQQVIRYNGASAVRDASGMPVLSAGGYGFGLGIRQNCDYRMVVTHTGGLPGFGSLMRWLPDYGVGFVAMGNLTYTSWGAMADTVVTIMARTGGLSPRVPLPAPVLVTRRDQVTRLVTQWDDALADSVAAMNLFLDESKARRRAAIEQVIGNAGGACKNAGELVPLNALRGSWRMRCKNSDVQVTVTLAPTIPAAVQFLTVRPLGREQTLDAAPVCR